ncbi:MAG: SRPBCC family protein [Gammaproteobacteria bacterium]|nr:MAG: SRPBCC family protein [Gammaproteobacteria bacterium]
MGSLLRVLVSFVPLITCGIGLVTAGGRDWQPETNGWDYLHRVDHIDLYRKPVAGSRFPVLRARTRMEVPATKAFRVISDYDHFADFLPAVSASRVLAQSGGNTWVYQRLGMPMLVADRHYVIRVTDTFDEVHNGLIRVNWQLDANRSRTLSTNNAVLPDVFTGSWRLEDTADGEGCDAIYTIHVEPGGRLPAWLFSRAAKAYVINVVDAVRSRAR